MVVGSLIILKKPSCPTRKQLWKDGHADGARRLCRARDGTRVSDGGGFRFRLGAIALRPPHAASTLPACSLRTATHTGTIRTHSRQHTRHQSWRERTITMRCHQKQQLPAHNHHTRLSRPAVGRRRVRAAAAASGATGACAREPTPGNPGAGPPVLVVPAFYLDAMAFRPLVEELRARGYNAALPPVR